MILALDIGGTSVRAALADPAGHILSTGRSQGGNVMSIDRDTVVRRLAEAIGVATRGRPSKPTLIVAGVAGVSRVVDDPAAARASELIGEALARVGVGPIPIQVTSDADAAFASGSGDEGDGIVLVAGTGAVAARYRGFHAVTTTDGHGVLLDDAGGGLWIGRASARAALRALDHRAEWTTLVSGIRRSWHLDGVDTPEATDDERASLRMRIIHAAHAEPQRLSELTRLVIEGASVNDGVCLDLLQSAAGELAQSVRALSPQQHDTIVLAGGLAGTGGALEERIRALLAPWETQTVTVLDGIAGAVRLGVNQRGAGRRNAVPPHNKEFQEMYTHKASAPDGVSNEDVGADAFLRRASVIVERVNRTSRDAVKAAAKIMAGSITNGGIIQAYGTGHSQSAAMELAGRAGGLVPTNRISISDIVIFGGQMPQALADPLLERNEGFAQELYDLVQAETQDVFVIISNSGVNSSIVDMALLAKANSHQLIAITSLEHSRGVPAKHSTGKRLADIADVTLDNGAPLGDVLIPLPTGGAFGAVSSITSAYLVQQVVAEVVAILVAAGETPPVYLSANVADGHETNLLKEAEYGSRLRRIAT